MRVRLTAANIRALPAAGPRAEYRDTVQPGLILRVTPAGGRTWAVAYKAAGRTRRYRIGALDHMDLAAAREAARQIRSKVALGADPQRERNETRRTVVGLTVGALIARFLGAVGRPRGPALRATTRREWMRLFKVEVSDAIRATPASQLARATIREWGRGMATRSASTALNAHQALARVFSWAVAEELIPASPFHGLPPPAARPRSERVLSLDELRALLRVLEAYPRRRYPAVLELLLLTATRKGAVLGMERGELQDVDGPEPLWLVPPERAKRRAGGRAAGLPHVVPLSAWAVRLIRERLEAVGPRRRHLFPPARARKAGEAPKSKAATLPSRFLADVRQRVTQALGAAVPRWTVHGLRHTATTHMREQLGISGEVAALLLGHTRQGTIGIYDRSALLAERRAALVAWAAWLERLRDGAVGAKVLPHRRKG